jgi:hypothetical protein
MAYGASALYQRRFLMVTNQQSKAEQKQFDAPDETLEFPLGRADLVNIGGGVVGRIEAQPGWRWSTHMKEAAGTEWCEAVHFQYHRAGILRVQMADGTEFDVKPGDVLMLPPGHDAWVVGDTPVVVVDWTGTSKYAVKA